MGTPSGGATEGQQERTAREGSSAVRTAGQVWAEDWVSGETAMVMARTIATASYEEVRHDVMVGGRGNSEQAGSSEQHGQHGAYGNGTEVILNEGSQDGVQQAFLDYQQVGTTA